MSVNYKYIPVLMLMMVSVYAGCKKKTDTIIQEVEQPFSKFETKVREPSLKSLIDAKVNFVDSNFYFINKSDSTSDITYKWDFGDGNSSAQRHPAHKYTASGKYKVKLITSRGEVTAEASELELSVVLGEKYFPVATNFTTTATDLLELRNNDIILIGSTANMDNNMYFTNHFLMRISSDLKQKALKNFSPDVQLGSISECTDGNLIATGTLSRNQYFNEVIKMTPEGEKIWSKVYGENDDFYKIQETAGAGFILTGSRIIYENWKPVSKTLIVKLNSEGVVEWERFFGAGDLILDQARNVIVEADGYVVPANKKGDKIPNCKCDSLALVKLKLDGSVAWKSTVQWALNGENTPLARGSKMKNGNYQIGAGFTEALFILSPEGKFLERRLVSSPIFSTAATEDGDIAVLAEEHGNGYRATLYGYSGSGVYKWTYRTTGSRTVDGAYTCCADSWPVTVKPLKGGGSIFLANHVIPLSYRYVPVIVKIDKDGKVL